MAFSTHRHLAAAAAVLVAPAFLAMPALAGGGSGSAETSDFGSQETVAFTGLNTPYGVAVSGATGSTVLATSYPDEGLTSASVQKLVGSQTTLATGDVASPFGVTLDSAGNAYVTDASDNKVIKVPANGAAASTLSITGLSFPTGVAVDAAGNVFVADSGNARVVKEPADGGAQSDVAFTGLASPYGVAVDANSVYVVDLDANNVKAVAAAGGGAQSTLGFTGLSSPDGIAVAGGTVYVADADNNRIVTLPAAGGTQSVMGFTGLSAPAGVAVSTNGSVFVADSGNNRVVKLPVPANSPAQSFVVAAYNDYLQRNPTAAELSAGVSMVGDVTIASKRTTFVKSLANSDKYVGAFVNKLYFDTLGRAGDPGGVGFWSRQLQSKSKTPAQVSGAFYGSNEYFRGFGNSDNATWVRDLYMKVVLRPATNDEVTFSLALLQSRTRTSVATSLFQGDESARVRVRALYQRFLGRGPDAGGLTFWANRIPTQGDLALAVNLSSSNEYLRKSAVRYP